MHQFRVGLQFRDGKQAASPGIAQESFLRPHRTEEATDQRQQVLHLSTAAPQARTTDGA